MCDFCVISAGMCFALIHGSFTQKSNQPILFELDFEVAAKLANDFSGIV